MRPHLAITMGDPAGVGPEIIVKACERLRHRLEAGELRLLVIGSCPALRAARAAARRSARDPGGRAKEADWPALACLQAAPEGEPILPGVLSAEGGRFAYAAIERGVRLAQAGRVQGIVTAPLNKEALNKAGHHYAGHTEMLADAHRREGLGDDAGARQHAREPCQHARGAGGRAEAADPGAAAPASSTSPTRPCATSAWRGRGSRSRP